MTDLKKPSIITCKHLNIKQIYLNLFVHLGAAETRFEHNIDIIVSEQTVAYLHIQQTQKDIINHLESCFWPPDDCKPNMNPHVGSVWVSTDSWGKYQALKLLNAPLCC